MPARLLVVLPVGLLDALFYWWTFSALTQTLAKLVTRRQSAKLTLYRRFTYVLIVEVAVSVGWVSWQMAFIVNDRLDEWWASLWVFDAFWHCLYFAVLVSITWLWSPSINNLQYAYMDEVGQDDDEAEDEADTSK